MNSRHDAAAPWSPRTAVQLAAGFLTALGIACGAAPSGGDEAAETGIPVATFAGDGRTVEVVRVLDGDTIDVRVDGTTERVRILGVDAPERGGSDRHPLQEQEIYGKYVVNMYRQPKIGSSVRKGNSRVIFSTT